MAAALDVGQQVVAAHHAGIFLAVHGVEVGGVLGQRLVLLPVDVVVEGVAALVALVGDGDAGRLAEGHRPVAVPAAAVGGDADGQRDEGLVHAVADAEEIADGALDAGMLLAVPVDAQRQQARVEGRLVGDGVPDVGDHARAFQLGQHERAAGLDGAGVAVAVAPVAGAGRGAHGLELFELLQAGEGVAGGELGQRVEAEAQGEGEAEEACSQSHR